MTAQWDEDKNKENIRKHGVSFEEAQELLLSGVDYYEVYDRAHSLVEDRFIAVGPTRRGKLAVVWTERETSGFRSVSSTERPASASSRAVSRPDRPAPTTTVS